MTRPAIHPGEILAGELEELEITASELARTLHVPTNRITQIVNGQRGITADTALRLGQWLGTGPELWLNLQKSYELRSAEQEVGEEIASTVMRRSSRVVHEAPSVLSQQEQARDAQRRQGLASLTRMGNEMGDYD